MTSTHLHEGRDRHPQLLSEEGLLYLGGLMGLTPSFRAGGNGQPLAEAAEALKEVPTEPDTGDTEYAEREPPVSGE